MTQYLRSLAVLLTFSGLGLAGCGSADKDDNPAPNTTLTERTAFLTQVTWIQTSSTTTDIENGVATRYNLFPTAPLCMRDNTMMFHPDQTYIDDEGQTRCDSTASQIRNTGTWAFEANGSELAITNKQGYTARWRVAKFTATEHVLTRTGPVPGLGVTRIDTVIYRAL